MSKLKLITDRNRDDSREKLQEAIDMELTEVIVIGKDKDGMLAIGHSSFVNRLQLVGALEEIKFQLMLESIE